MGIVEKITNVIIGGILGIVGAYILYAVAKAVIITEPEIAPQIEKILVVAIGGIIGIIAGTAKTEDC